MSFRLKVRNYRGLRQAEWSPEGVCALVGANGSGKTTLLDVPQLLGDALNGGFARALEDHGGIAHARNVNASPKEPYFFEVAVDELTWKLLPVQSGAGFRPEEHITLGKKEIVRRGPGADFARIGDKDEVPARDVLAASIAINELPEVEPLGRVLSRYRLYGQYDLHALRRSGSPETSERRLNRRGTNVFSVLRNWRDKKADRERYAFVIEGLRRTFSDFFDDLDFAKAAQVVGVEVQLKNVEQALSASLAPDGWFVALLHLAAVASTDKGDVIAIDEPENALHPHAIKGLLELVRRWTKQHRSTVLFATHSPVMLDAFRECPDQLYVIEPSMKVVPQPLSRLKEPNWLNHFALGDLYAHEEFGAPAVR